LSLSPDEQLLAYLRWNGQALELVLHHLLSGWHDQRTEFTVRHKEGAHILWSPHERARY